MIGEREDGDDEEKGEVVDLQKKQRSKVWEHFTLVAKYGNAQGLWRCHGRGEDDIAARLDSTSNLLSHARLRCPKALTLITGNSKDNDQATLGGINIVIPPFTKTRFWNLGPGTADNAGNNITPADRLNERLCGELLLDSPGGPMRCICHIANLAATDYLKAECGLQSCSKQRFRNAFC
jgi:hypothetical protein